MRSKLRHRRKRARGGKELECHGRGKVSCENLWRCLWLMRNGSGTLDGGEKWIKGWRDHEGTCLVEVIQKCGRTRHIQKRRKKKGRKRGKKEREDRGRGVRSWTSSLVSGEKGFAEDCMSSGEGWERNCGLFYLVWNYSHPCIDLKRETTLQVTSVTLPSGDTDSNRY